MNPLTTIGQACITFSAMTPGLQAACLIMTFVSTIIVASALRRLFRPLGLLGFGAFSAICFGVWRATEML